MRQPLLCMSTGTLVSYAGTRYNLIYGGGPWSGVIANHQQLVASPGTISHLRIKLDVAPGAGTSYTFTFMKNAVATAIVVTIADTETSGSDTTHSVAVSPGDYIQVRAVPSGAAATVRPRYSLIFEGDNAGESIFPGGVATIIGDAIRYNQLAGGMGWDLVEGTPYQTIPISGTSTSGNNTTDEVAVSPGDKVLLRGVPTGGPASVNVQWGTTFLADNTTESLILGNGYPLETADCYLPLANGQSGYSTTEALVEQPMQEFSISDWYMNLSDAPGSGKGYIYTIRKNNANTALTITISDLNTSGNDTTHSAKFADDDEVAILIDPQLSPSRRTMYWGVKVTEVTAGRSQAHVIG